MDAGVPPCLDLRARTDGPGNCSGSAPAEGPGRPRSPTVSHDPGVYGLSRPYDGLGRSKTLGTYRLGNRQGVFQSCTHPQQPPWPHSPRQARRSSPLQGERQTPPYPAAFGEGSSGRAPHACNHAEIHSPNWRAALHPLQGERRILATSPEEGEGSSAHPSPACAKPPTAAAALAPLPSLPLSLLCPLPSPLPHEGLPGKAPR